LNLYEHRASHDMLHNFNQKIPLNKYLLNINFNQIELKIVSVNRQLAGRLLCFSHNKGNQMHPANAVFMSEVNLLNLTKAEE
jgi:hypothetical protein